MKCPVCIDSVLQITERQSVEIDYCPQCRGVWLDRGELDKLIARSTDDYANDSRSTSPPRAPAYQDKYEDKHYAKQEYAHSHVKHKKRSSFLGDLFDF